MSVRKTLTLTHAAGDADGDITFWDYRKFREEGADNAKLKVYPHGLSPICDLYFDNNKLVSASKQGVIKIWRLDLQSADNVASCTIPLEARLWCFQGDDRALVCGDRQGFVHTLDFGDIREYLAGSNSKAAAKDEGCVLQ